MHTLKYSPQEAFNIVWNAFVVRKEPFSAVENEESCTGFNCLYRGPDGAKCAAGHLIPDDVFKESWEGSGIYYLIGRDLEFDLGFTSAKTEQFISKLQEAHDRAAANHLRDNEDFHESIEHSLRNFAMTYSLTLPQNDA